MKYQKDSEKPYTGEVFRLYNTGEKLYQGTYEDGLLITYSYFKKDGSMKEPINYETELIENNGIYLTQINNELFSGQVFSLHDNGNLKCRGALFNGESFGRWTYFNKGGDSTETTVPPIKYFDLIRKSEIATEDALISAIRSGLTIYANNSLYENGRAEWPTNPFDALAEKPAGYDATDNGLEVALTQMDGVADSDGEWTFDFNSSRITHQRADNSRYEWSYDPGIQGGYGSLGQRTEIQGSK